VKIAARHDDRTLQFFELSGIQFCLHCFLVGLDFAIKMQSRDAEL